MTLKINTLRQLIPLLCAIILSACASPTASNSSNTRVAIPPMQVDTSRFAHATAPRTFDFPQDFYAHNDFQTEWWYFTGNAQDEQGRHFGYQFTIFRRALTPDATTTTNSFSTRQIYFAHFALTDTAADKHVAFERFSRGASNLAGASSELRKVFIEDWTIEIADDTASAFRLVAREGDYQINLDVKSTKPPALQGDRGLSQKGSTVGNASYYYSLTRMQTTGEIKTPSGVYRVQGSSWMDREWSTSVLEANVVGWDWFALQLDDQRDIMLFQLRDASGARFSSIKGALIDASGNVQVFKADDVTLDVIDHWTSPSGVRYPSKWQLRLPRLNLDLEIAPRIKDQEMKNISTQYWEGAVSIAGKATNNAINGVGYVELTGYAAPMNGRL